MRERKGKGGNRISSAQLETITTRGINTISGRIGRRRTMKMYPYSVYLLASSNCTADLFGICHVSYTVSWSLSYIDQHPPQNHHYHLSVDERASFVIHTRSHSSSSSPFLPHWDLSVVHEVGYAPLSECHRFRIEFHTEQHTRPRLSPRISLST